jgi:hypothetical protein
MNLRNVRAFFVMTLALGIVLVSMMMLDYFYANSRFFAAILTCFGVAVILTAAIMIFLVNEESAPRLIETVVEEVPLRASARTITAQPTIIEGLSPWDEAAIAPAGPFEFNGYTLYSRDVKLKGAKQRTIYFFSKRTPKSGVPAPKPVGYHVGMNEDSGLPFLKKGGGRDGEDLTPQHEHGLRPQCSALTEDGKQCRNSSRAASKYCASHFGYQPPLIAKAEAVRRDTLARVKDAPDTIPAIRHKTAAR